MPGLDPLGPGFRPGSPGPGGPPRIADPDPSGRQGTVAVSPPTVERGPTSAAPLVSVRLRQVLPRFRACFQRTLRLNPTSQAVLRVRVETDRQGRVRSATLASTARGDVFETCALQSLRRVVFSPPRSELTFSFLLRARP